MTADARAAGTAADARLLALFPHEYGVARPSRLRRRSSIAIGLGIVAALIVAAGVATAAAGSSGADYRTATVRREHVDSVLTGVAVIEPIAQATVAFPVDGTVATVNVQPGESVEAGGVLATLDTKSLEEAVHTKQAALAQAQLSLSRALSGESVGGVNASIGGNGSSSASSAATAAAFRLGTATPRVVLAAATPTPDPALAAAQQAVVDAQHEVDTTMQAADTALANETTGCTAFLDGSASSTVPEPTPDATACQRAISAVVVAQRNVADAQKALVTASAALDALLAQNVSAPATTTPPTTTPPATTPPATTPPATTPPESAPTNTASGRSSSSRTTGAGGTPPSAADIVADQASVDAAAYAVAAAQQAVDSATITSPLAGNVVAVNLKVGETISASSSTEDIVVKGAGGYEISTAVNVDVIPSVAVGQPAVVVPDGIHRDLTGKVVEISVVPASTTTTSTMYHVIVGLAKPDTALDDGATGTVSIVTNQAHAALAVPASAITTIRGRHTVSVLRNGTPTVVPVETGVIGDTWAEIKRGVSAGETVVLADLSAPLPDSATASTNTTQGTTGRFGGFGGFIPGGTNGGRGSGGAGRPG